jgi:hypothetical protein
MDYRLAISFGDVNEVRLVTETPLTALKSMRLSFDDGSELELLEIQREKLPSGSATSAALTRSMMTKVLEGLRAGGGILELVLPAGVPTIELPVANRAEAWMGVRACEKARLGEVVPD